MGLPGSRLPGDGEDCSMGNFNICPSSVVRTQGPGASAPQPSGASGQLGKEQTLPCAEYLFSWYGVGFGRHVGTSHERVCPVGAELPEPIQTQDSSPSQTFSEASGAYGSRSYAAQTASYKTAPALALQPDPEMGMAPQHVPGQRYPGMSPPFQPLVRPCVPTGRCAPGSGVEACGCEHGCLQDRLRCRMQLCSRCALTAAHSSWRMAIPPPGGPAKIRPHLIPSWDLSVVLLGFRRVPFEPLASVELKYLSLKTVLLIALTSIKRVGDLHAFSVSESCLEFGPADSHVTLRPRLGYVPKVPTTPFRDQVVNLQALPLEEADPALALLCSVRALRTYLDRTQSFRCSEQLFVCFGGQQKGNAVSKQRSAHWVVDAITLAYQCQGEPCPLGVRAHSTRCVVSFWAHGASLADICRAAGWATPNTFARFYNLRVTSGNLREDGSVSVCCAIPIGPVRFFPVVPLGELWVLLAPTIRIRTEFSGLCLVGASFTPPGRGIMSQSMFPYHVFQSSPRDFILVIVLRPPNGCFRYLAPLVDPLSGLQGVGKRMTEGERCGYIRNPRSLKEGRETLRPLATILDCAGALGFGSAPQLKSE
ncbi:adenylate kinase [Labeo rohita]|uniref:Adenylate kinase n=1 Tax=Labeo rohita TaxID=84645 RepID=A0ABQ8M535_LABRO|nr:adenylate kinase [Labeo rohita]